MTLYSDFTIHNFSIMIETDNDHVMIFEKLVFDHTISYVDR